MSALQVGSSGLAAQQAGLQVTGNNIANASTPGYARETAQLTTAPDVNAGNNVAVGGGVVVNGVNRQVSAALQAGLQNANSDNQAAQTLQTVLSQVQSTFGTLNQNDLSAQTNSFFNSFSNLANNPQNSGQRALVIQGGATLAGYIQTLRGNLVGLHNSVQSQYQTLAQQVSGLTQSIAALNGKIGQTQGAGASSNSLQDQRDAALAQLSNIMNIRTVDAGNGQVNVLVGSTPLVQGTQAQAVSVAQTANSLNLPVYQLEITNNQQIITPSSGKLAALAGAGTNTVDGAISTLDTFANALIGVVNTVSSQGQGLTGMTTATATNAVTNANAALNAGTAATGLAFTPVNGAFTLTITNSATGQSVNKQIVVNLSGAGTPTTLNSLAAQLTAAGLNASVNSSGQLTLATAGPGSTFSFSGDTSGTLAALGINTFFTGSNAANIGVNPALSANSNLLATAQNNTPGSNANAVALANGFTAANTLLNGQNLQQFYTTYVGTLATQGQTAQQNATAQAAIYSSVQAQQQSYSGVNMNEEALNLISYQQGFSSAAKYISIVDQMMQTMLAMVQ